MAESARRCVIPLRGRNGQPRAWAKVDADDYLRLAQHAWHLTSGGYAARSTHEGGKRGTVYMHREILGLTAKELEGDHLDGDTLNNHRANLRIVDRLAQMQNVRARPGTSTFRGVYRRQDTHRWAAQVTAHRRRVHLGSFETEIEAATAAHRYREAHGIPHRGASWA